MPSLLHRLLLVLCLSVIQAACGPSLYEQREAILNDHIREMNQMVRQYNNVALLDRATLAWGQYFETPPITGKDPQGRLVLKWIKRKNDEIFDGSFDARGRGTYIPGFTIVLVERLTLYFDPETKVQIDGWYEAQRYTQEHY